MPWAAKSDPVLTVIESRSGALADVLNFTPSAAAAKRESDTMLAGRVTVRNVVFDIEAEVGLGLPEDALIAGCLRSS